ncbi:MAG: UDP-N-acetylmuramoyl-L-alanyl-D-glutamate--2,6-diaminopimelate ligase [Melioribacteraceae bacterium]|nr:UDP-N-acetylmuramoyl-L-alanyl-D-glutamate--2,6-diaminopimelate ligase [Melioribacteraceae bacterium]
MKLSELLNNVSVIQVIGNAELKEVDNLSIDSRSINKGTIFFAIKGQKNDGHNFVADVINKGVAAIVIENEKIVPDDLLKHYDCVKILVKDTKKSLAEFSNYFYGEPSQKLNVIGVTGTKGKSTTAFFVKSIFEENKNKCGLIGTIANYIGNEKLETSLTTPQANEINFLFSEMLKKDCSHCVMEVSSHALDLNRVDYIKFNSAIFTNITSDHMDYHKTFEHYFNSKKILFDKVNEDGFVIYNNDDPNGEKIVAESKAKKISYGTKKNSDIKIQNIKYDLNGTKFEILWNGNSYKLETKLIGIFNAYNAASAFAVAVVNGVEPQVAIEGIKNTSQVPGRFEVVSSKNKKVIIDYSHTSDSLKQALEAIHHIVKGERKIYTVFGCGGDRDKTKRPIMGSIASEMSHRVYITSDNPRTEDPFAIIDEIVRGIKKNNYMIIENREEAIRSAIYESEDDAVILVAGKGHENYQDVNGVKKHFSDKEISEKYLIEWAK